MVDQAQRGSIEADFSRKRKTYYSSNYGKETFQNSIRRERRDQINQWIDGVRDARRVLDIGCGPALLYPEAKSRCDAYYAMDIVQSNLDEVLESDPNVTTIHADLDSIQWQHDAPTLIVCSGCIEYSQNGMQNLSRICHILDSGGTIIVSFPNVLSPYRIWFEFGYRQLVRAIDRSASRSTYGRTLFRLGAVKELFERENMELVATRRLGYCFVPPPFDNWLPQTSFRVRQFLELRMPFLGTFSTEFAVLARKRS